MPEKIKRYTDKSRVFIKGKFTEDGAGWLFLQQLIIAPMSLLTTVLLAKILSISDYGYYKYILSVYSVLAVFGLTGFYSIASLNIQRGQDNFFYIGFKYRKLLRWIPAILSLFISSYYFIMGNNFFGFIFLITIFSHLFVDLYDFYTVGTIGKGNYKLNAKLSILNYFLSFFPPIIVAYYTHNLYYIFGTMFIFQFIFRFFTFKYVSTKFFIQSKNIETEEKKQKDFKKEAISFSANNMFSNLSGNLSGAIVFNRLGAESNAIYSLAITFADFAYGIILAPISKVLFSLSQMTKNNTLLADKVRYIKDIMKNYFFFSLLLTIICMIALPFVYTFLFPKYLFSYKYAVIYSISIVAVSFYPAYYYFLEKRNIKMLNIIQIFILGINLVLMFFGAMYFGVWGAIVVAIFMRFLNNLIYFFFLKRE